MSYEPGSRSSISNAPVGPAGVLARKPARTDAIAGGVPSDFAITPLIEPGEASVILMLVSPVFALVPSVKLSRPWLECRAACSLYGPSGKPWIVNAPAPSVVAVENPASDIDSASPPPHTS